VGEPAALLHGQVPQGGVEDVAQASAPEAVVDDSGLQRLVGESAHVPRGDVVADLLREQSQ
jgi:hypothetical protein